MSLRRRHRITVIIGAVFAVAVAAAGVTYAGTTLPASVKACENAHGTLRLLSSGTCPAGYTKVSIGKVGPKGETGPRGPGAISILAQSTSGSDFHDVVVPGFGLTARAVCSPNSQSSVYLLDTAASTNFDVRGTVVRSNSGSALVVWSNGLNQNTPIPAGASLQSYQQTATTPNAAFEFVNTSGDLNGDVIVTRGAATFTLSFYTIQTASDCLVQGQITPAT